MLSLESVVWGLGAKDWLLLGLAEDSWQWLEVSGKWLTSQSPLLKRLGLLRWPGNASEFNNPLPELQWLALADLEHLLGEADLSGLLVNNVVLGAGDGDVLDVAEKLLQWSWDDALLQALLGLLLVPLLVLGWDSLATWGTLGGRSRLVEDVGDSANLWGHDALPWRLQVSGVLTVHVSAKTDSAAPDESGSNNLDPLAVVDNGKRLLWEVKPVGVVVVPLHLNLNVGTLRRLNLLVLSWSQLLLVSVNLDGGRSSLWGDLDLELTGDDPNLLLRSGLQRPGEDSNWEVLGAILKEEVLTVVDLVSVSLVVEGGDEPWLNSTSDWNAVQGEPLSKVRLGRVVNSQWEEVLGVSGETDVLDPKDLSRWSVNLGLGNVSLTVNLSLNPQSRHLRSLLVRDLSNKAGLDNLPNKVPEGTPAEGRWDPLNLKLELVKGSGLNAGLAADLSQLPALLHLLLALLVLWGLLDGLLLLLGLHHLSGELDLVLLASLSMLKLSVVFNGKVLLDKLFQVPPVLWLGHGSLTIVLESINFRVRSGLEVQGGEGLDNVFVVLRGLSNDEGGLEALGRVLSLGRSGEGEEGGLALLGSLNLLKDGLDRVKSGFDLAAAHLLGSMAVGPELKPELQLLSGRLAWVVLDLGGRHPDGGWDDKNIWKGEKRGLPDLLKVRGEVRVNVVGLGDKLARETNRVSDWNLNHAWGSVKDLPHVRGLGSWLDRQKGGLEGVWENETVKGLSLASVGLNLSWVPDDNFEFTAVDLGLDSDWDGRVDGSLNSGTNKLLSEWADDSHGGLSLNVEDWGKGSLNLWKWHTTLESWFVGNLDVSLSRVDDWESNGVVNWETSIGHSVAGSLLPDSSTNSVEGKSLLSLLSLAGELSKGVHDGLGVEEAVVLNSQDGRLSEELGWLESTVLDAQLLSNLLELLPGLFGGLSGVGEVLDVLLNNLVHTLQVSFPGESSDLESALLLVEPHGLGNPQWDHGLLALLQLKTSDDSTPEVLDVLAEVHVPGVHESGVVLLHDWERNDGVVRDWLELWNLSLRERVESGTDEVGNLPAWLEPGADGKGLDVVGGWLSERQDSNSSSPDFWSLSWVLDGGHQQWLNVGWVHPGGPLQGVDGEWPQDLTLFGPLLLRSSLDLLNLALSNLEESHGGLDVSSPAKAGNSRVLQVLLVRLRSNSGLLTLSKSGQEWDELLGKDLGVPGSENSVKLAWEVVDHVGWVDVSTVEQVRKLGKDDGKDGPVGLDSLGLGQTNKLPEELLSWVPDVPDGVLDDLDGLSGWERSLLNLPDDEHGGWVGSNTGNGVPEQLFEWHKLLSLLSLSLALLSLLLLHGVLPNLLFQLLKLVKREVAEVLGDGGHGSGNVRLGSARFWGLRNLSGHLLQLLESLALDGFPWDGEWEKGLWGLGQSWLWKHWADTQDLPRFLEDLLRDLSLLLLLLWVGIDDGLFLLGFRWDWKTLRDGLNLQKLEVDLGGGPESLVSLEADWVVLDDVLSLDLADLELGKLAADEVSGGGGVEDKTSTGAWLGQVAPSGNSGPLLEDWRSLTVVEVLDLDDLVVWLALALVLSLLGLGLLRPLLRRLGVLSLTSSLHLLLFLSPLLLELLNLVGWEPVDGVGGPALSVDGLLLGVEVRHARKTRLSRNFRLLWGWELDVVGLELGALSSGNIELKLGKDGPLDVGDSRWLLPGNKEAGDDTALVVDEERLLKETHVALWDVTSLRARVSLDPSGLSELDVSVQGAELDVLHLDAKRVVREGLDADLRLQDETSMLTPVDLRNTVEDLGFELVDGLLSSSPSVPVQGRVGVDGGDHQEEGTHKLHRCS